MGNMSCGCAPRRPKNISENHRNSIIVERSMPINKCDNAPMPSFVMEDIIPLNTNNDKHEDVVETPVITQKHQNKYQTQIHSVPPPVYFRSSDHCHQDDRRTTSLFCFEDTVDAESLPNYISPEIYDVILRDFLIHYYPMNDDIIKEMMSKNLLLSQDAEILLSQPSDKEKSQSFLNNFVFSEINICKLATFLNVLITESSRLLDVFKKTKKLFKSIVDHIYYVVNVLSLFLESTKDKKPLPSLKYLASSITIICGENLKRILGISADQFYVTLCLTGITFSTQFWKDFSCINEHFKCCQELTLSSCELQPDDIANLVRAFKGAGILRELDISTNPITDQGLKHLEALFQEKNSLVSLNIACCSLSSTGVEMFLEMIAKGNIKSGLRHLNISHNDLGNMAENSVLLLTTLPINLLEMKSVNIRHQKALFQSLKLNSSLKQIDLSGNRLLSNDVTYLAEGLAYNSCLQRLSLSMTGLLRSDCATINNALLMNKAIVSLDLSDNMIGDEGAQLLKDILTLKPTLREVYLKRCGISVHGVLVLLRTVSEKNCDLKLLDLCYNHSPRMSIVVDIKEVIRKIQDVMHHISLVKDTRILLWGTIDEPLLVRSNCLDL